MKGVPIIKNFKRLSIKHLLKLILYESDVKLLKLLKLLRDVLYRPICVCLKCENLIIDT